MLGIMLMPMMGLEVFGSGGSGMIGALAVRVAHPMDGGLLISIGDSETRSP
jgi:hypothetical protein